MTVPRSPLRPVLRSPLYNPLDGPWGVVAAPPGGYSAEATTYFAAMSVQPSAGRKDKINTLFVALASIWSKFDILYLMNAHDQQAANLNAKNPATFTLIPDVTFVPVFTVDVGYGGNGTNKRINTTFNASTAGGVFTQNSAHISVWSRTAATDGGPAMGQSSGAANLTNLYPRHTSGNCFARLNDVSPAGGVTSGDGSGHFVSNRSSSTVRDIWRNGVSLGAIGAVTSTPPPSTAFMLLGDAVLSSFFAGQLAIASAGSSLTIGEAVTFYNAISTYITAVDGGEGFAGMSFDDGNSINWDDGNPLGWDI